MGFVEIIEEAEEECNPKNCNGRTLSDLLTTQQGSSGAWLLYAHTTQLAQDGTAGREVTTGRW